METNNNQENKKANRIFRQISFAKTMAIMSVITFVVTFVVYLLLDNNIKCVYSSYTQKNGYLFGYIFVCVFLFMEVFI